MQSYVKVFFLFHAGRKKLGFPAWEIVEKWVCPEFEVKYLASEPEQDLEIENPEIPELRDYEKGVPDDSFWLKFP